MNINNPNFTDPKKLKVKVSKKNDNNENNENNGDNSKDKVEYDNNIDNKNRINYIQLSNNNKGKNKKKKNKKYIREQIKEQYDDYLEMRNNNDSIIDKSFENLLLLESKFINDNKNNVVRTNSILKSKSLNNLNKVEEMKNCIRKNSSYNLIGDIVLEINQNVGKTDIIQQVKKIKSSNSMSNITKQSITPTKKFHPNDSNRYSYLVGDDYIELEQDNDKNKSQNINTINVDKQNLSSFTDSKINKKNKKSPINFEEIKNLEEKINSVADYHLIHTPFKMIGEEILNEEIIGKYKPKLKTEPENEQIIKKLKDTFKKLVYKEIKAKPNISQILLDNTLDDELKVKILRKYIKFTTEDDVFSDEADKIKIEIKNLLKQKKLRLSDDYEELGKQLELKILPINLKNKLEDIYYRVIGGDQPKLHNLLNNILKLPFEKKPNILDTISNELVPKEEKILFIKKLYSKMDMDLFGMEETKDSIISWICQKINNPTKNSTKYLCLCGPAGVGKTSIVHSISESLGIPYSYISLANIDDPCSLIGHGYTYEGSQYGSIANGLISNGCTNGILLFDELDKTKEKVQNTLLGIFDPMQNTKFRDAYFGEFNLNLSECMMIICLNDLSKINPILRDRLHIVNLSGYSTKDKKIIVQKYILPKLNNTFNLNKIEIEDKVIDEIIERTKKFEGIRQIQMYLTKIYEFVVLDEYTNKYNLGGVFGIKNIGLLKLVEQNVSYLSIYS
jgi:ATP-dependent Lon protease